jgi:putative transcriptional regulator
MGTASDQAPAAQRSLGRGADDPVRIRVRRVELNISRTELALRVNVGKSTIAGIENGHHRPSLELAQKIASALDSNVAELFTLRECACGCGELMVDQDRLGSSARFLPGHNCREPEHAAACTRGHQARRARLGIPEEKICERCGRTFTRSEVPRSSLAHWLERRYCSGDCRWPVRAQERRCEQCGELIPRKVMSDNRDRRFCSRRCGQLDRWERLTDIPEAVLRALPPRARQRKLGKVKGREHGSLGGRPTVELTEKQLAEAVKLHGQGWGRDAIASRLLVSPHAVRKALYS